MNHSDGLKVVRVKVLLGESGVVHNLSLLTLNFLPHVWMGVTRAESVVFVCGLSRLFVLFIEKVDFAARFHSAVCHAVPHLRFEN